MTSLLDEVSRFSQLDRALDILKKKGKNTPGVDNVTLNDFCLFPRKNLRDISSELKNKSYRFDIVVKKSIPKKTKGKERDIGLYVIRDKVVQKSIQRSLERKRRTGTFFPEIYNSISIGFLSRDGGEEPTGVRKALAKIPQFYRAGYIYMVSADIVDFFENIDLKTLRNMIVRRLSDNSINWLIDQILHPFLIMKDIRSNTIGDPFQTSSGVTQGSILAPLFSNIYLMKFDKELESLDIPALRYADDLVFFSKSFSEAQQNLIAIGKVLKKFNLEFHSMNSTKRPKFYNLSNPVKWANFLGISIQYNPMKKIWYKKPVDSKIGELRDIITSELNPRNNKTLTERLGYLNSHISAWSQSYKFLKCTKRILSEIIGEIKELYKDRLRVLLVRKKIAYGRLDDSQLRFIGFSVNYPNRKRKTS